MLDQYYVRHTTVARSIAFAAHGSLQRLKRTQAGSPRNDIDTLLIGSNFFQARTSADARKLLAIPVSSQAA